MSERVMVAMSGGVDSSAAALLLLNQGYDVCGATLRLYDPPHADPDTPADWEDAKSVCQRLGIPHHVFSMYHEFKEKVIRRFAEDYVRGVTPNPCIVCNRQIKFGLLLEKALEMGFDFLATGHFARVEWDESRGRFLLKKASDPAKDQSYVLYSLSQRVLSHLLLPLGGLEKAAGRRLCEEHGLLTAHKPDSQDICFVPDGDYAGFLRSSCGVQSEGGDFVDEQGCPLGRHKGLIHYTVGQRKGLGLSLPAPLYVLEKNVEKNQVVLVSNDRLFSHTLIAEDCNWISIDRIEAPLQVTAKTRYSQAESPARVEDLGNGRVRVCFQQAQRAITPGQAVVFYDGDTVVGGGTIVETER